MEEGKLIECVPNFSEGKRKEVIKEIEKAIEGSEEGIKVLDSEMDADHNRAVITFAGVKEKILDAAFRGIATATKLIDMNFHKGEHPRIGATDVVPFVPIGSTTTEECIEIAHTLGRKVAEELKIPVYMYAQAALVKERQDLSFIRQGEYEGLKETIGKDPTRKPDYGEERLHPTAGAIVIGVRPPLIAYNVYLDTANISIAKKIAKTIRESSGGLPAVKALGFFIAQRNLSQVSMNMLDYKTTSLKTVFDEIHRLANQMGTTVLESEIVGLVPQDALPPTPEVSILLRNFTKDQILEYKLEKCGFKIR